jgi:hypothetical protein
MEHALERVTDYEQHVAGQNVVIEGSVGLYNVAEMEADVVLMYTVVVGLVRCVPGVGFHL